MRGTIMFKLLPALAASVFLLAFSAPTFAADVNTPGTTALPSDNSTSSGAAGNIGQGQSNTAPGQQNGSAGSMSNGSTGNDQSAQMPVQPNAPGNSDLSKQSNGGLTGKSNDAGTGGLSPSR
jgi:hypothetical protein